MEGLQVILVDDCKLDRETIKDGLSVHGVFIYDCENAVEALVYLENNRVDVAIIDLVLPGMSGLDLTWKIKESVPDTEVIIITANASLESSVKAMDYGAFAYLLKPLEIELLSRYLKRAKEKILASQLLVESERRFKNLLSAVTDYIYTVKVEHGKAVKTVHGENCVAVTGYTPIEYDADPDLWYRMIYDEDREMVLRSTKHILSGKDTGSIEHRLSHKSGAVIWISNTVVPHYDEDGNLMSYDGLVRDITIRKRAENALRKSEARLARAQKIAKMGNWEWDIASDYLYWSDEVYTIFGLSAKGSKPSYTNFLSRVHPEDRSKVEEAVKNAVDSKSNYSVEHRVVKDNGDIGFVYEMGELLFDVYGNVLGMSGTVQDITEYHKNQDIICHTTKLAALGELAASVAHEINNPMTAVLGYASLLREEVGEKSILYKDLVAIEKEGVRVREIVKQLLDFAKQRTFVKKQTDINYLLKQTLELVHHMAKYSGIEIVGDYEKEIPEILADPDQLKQVFLNLITNACQSLKAGGEIRISTRRFFNKTKKKDEIHIAVKDGGKGIEASVLKKIFEPFFTTKGEEGTGLGLSVSYGMIKGQGGDILVDSKPGEGSVFTVVLPIENMDASGKGKVSALSAL